MPITLYLLAIRAAKQLPLVSARHVSRMPSRYGAYVYLDWTFIRQTFLRQDVILKVTKACRLLIAGPLRVPE